MQKNRAENFTTVEVDPVNGEHYVIIPEWICDEKQWYEGTEVNIEVDASSGMPRSMLYDVMNDDENTTRRESVRCIVKD